MHIIWNGKILATGGSYESESESKNKNVYCYEPVEDKWNTMSSTGHASWYILTATSNIFYYTYLF